MRSGAELSSTGVNIIYDAVVEIGNRLLGLIKEQNKEALKPTGDASNKISQSIATLPANNESITDSIAVLTEKFAEKKII